MDFSKLSDIEIIQLYRDGNIEAPIFLINKYKPLVKQKARSYYLIGGDDDDLIQEGMIGLFKAIRDFDSNKNASFKTFASLCISRQIINAIKFDNRYKNTPLNSSFSLNTQVKNDENYEFIELITSMQGDNPEEIMITKENKLILEENIAKQLSALERNVLYYYLAGKNYSEISLILGKSEKSVDNALQRLRKKIVDIYSSINK